MHKPCMSDERNVTLNTLVSWHKVCFLKLTKKVPQSAVIGQQCHVSDHDYGQNCDWFSVTSQHQSLYQFSNAYIHYF